MTGRDQAIRSADLLVALFPSDSSHLEDLPACDHVAGVGTLSHSEVDQIHAELCDWAL
ncbi:MAG: hypothetical protein HY000_04665 [Planctomycetes bacterium]|nr:hypothetical protein [Planctomycetota bacterium]